MFALVAKCFTLYIRDVLQRDTETLRVMCHWIPGDHLLFLPYSWVPSLFFSAHIILFCLPNRILDMLLLSSLSACCLVPAVLINNLGEAKIVMSKCIETHWLPAAVLGDVSFQKRTWLIPWKFSKEHVIIPFNKHQIFKSLSNVVTCEDSEEHFLSSGEKLWCWDRVLNMRNFIWISTLNTSWLPGKSEK